MVYLHSPRVFQSLMVLSRDADRIMSGFSLVVAMEVTHPAWPSRVPRIAKLFCSEVMVEFASVTWVALGHHGGWLEGG